jgi:DNA-3-methyladenine glycosylase I
MALLESVERRGRFWNERERILRLRAKYGRESESGRKGAVAGQSGLGISGIQARGLTHAAPKASRSGMPNDKRATRRAALPKVRCWWAGSDPIYMHYHDTEWGVPVHDDRTLFEFLVLEGAQAGLSWITILKKRAAYRRAFANFDPRKVARFDGKKVQSLLLDPGIVKNKLKIESAVRNARAFLEVQEEFGSFDAYQWRFVDGRPIVNRWRARKDVPARTPLSDAFSEDLKQRGFNFVGSTIIYAHMQAVGMVNDHTTDCFRYRELLKAR